MHPEQEHSLRIQLATALRERDEAEANTRKWLSVVEKLRDNLNETLLERDEMKEALAAARRECATKDAALDRCHDLFSDIRGDWTDPRSQCREGMAVCRSALGAPAAAAGEEKA